MNSCYRTETLVSAYLEHEASPAETRFVEDHLATCSRCRETVAEVEALLSGLPHLPRMDVSPQFTSLVLARTHGMPALGVDSPEVVRVARRPMTWQVAFAAAAAVLVVVLGVRAVIQHPGAGPVTAERTPTAPESAPPETALPTGELLVPGPPPEVLTFGEGTGQSLGMARDAYLLGTYELRTPAGGGAPILTRVSARSEAAVTVTF